MDVLITGGTGLLGRQIVPALLDHGDRVRVLTLPDEDVSGLSTREIAIHRGDIRDPDTLTVPMRGVDTVLHLAGMMGVRRPMADYHAVNVTGTENVCRAALSAGVRHLVHVSSWTVYGMGLKRPATENFPLNPFPEPYAVTKAAGDRLVREMIDHEKLPAVILRPGTFFGPGDMLHFGRIADRLRARNSIIVGNGRNALPFLYVTDVVQGILLAATSPRASGTYNISTDAPLAQEEFLRATAEEVRTHPPHVHMPFSVVYHAGVMAEKAWGALFPEKQPPITRFETCLLGTDNRLSIDRARRELGYVPRVSVREGIRLAAEWYCSRPLPTHMATAEASAPIYRDARL